jgi:hypothetical protein
MVSIRYALDVINDIGIMFLGGFSGGGSRSTRREPPTMGKQLLEDTITAQTKIVEFEYV